MIYDELFSKTTEGFDIFTREWKPDNGKKGTICLVHGLGEHSGRYAQLADFFTRNGYALTVYDLRGHGKSGGKRGHTPSYDILLDDLHMIFRDMTVKNNDTRCFLYGHSLGGNIAINYALKYPKDIQGLVITSPWLELAKAPSFIKVVLAKAMCAVRPSFTQKNGLRASDLSHATVVAENYVKDPLVHKFITAKLFLEIRKAGKSASRNAANMKVPMLLMHGDNDRITSFNASRRFAEAAGDICTFKAWHGLYHELHNEPTKDEVLNYILDWLNII